MLIAVKHTINNPINFWGITKNNLRLLPDSGVIRVVSILPNPDMNEAIFIWEADSIDTLADYLSRTLGKWSKEEYQEISTVNAIGLPV
ncbi:MAG TPA: hypothetical protein VIK74_00165 [Parasegetibacter sp.]|jgi:hypothetical protein